MSKPTAAMELMFSERLQKMRDPIGTRRTSRAKAETKALVRWFVGPRRFS